MTDFPVRLTVSPAERAMLAHLLHRCDIEGRVSIDAHDIAARTEFSLAEVLAAAIQLNRRGVLVADPGETMPEPAASVAPGGASEAEGTPDPSHRPRSP